MSQPFARCSLSPVHLALLITCAGAFAPANGVGASPAPSPQAPDKQTVTEVEREAQRHWAKIRSASGPQGANFDDTFERSLSFFWSEVHATAHEAFQELAEEPNFVHRHHR